jgi:hypothetical protein
MVRREEKCRSSCVALKTAHVAISCSLDDLAFRHHSAAYHIISIVVYVVLLFMGTWWWSRFFRPHRRSWRWVCGSRIMPRFQTCDDAVSFWDSTVIQCKPAIRHILFRNDFRLPIADCRLPTMTMMPQRQRSLLLFPLVILAAVLSLGNAFQSPMVAVPLMSANAGRVYDELLVAKSTPVGVTALLVPPETATAPTMDSWTAASSTTLLAAADAATLDPTTFLTNILSGVLNTPLILAVPIVAALSVAGLMAFLIISYASPEVDED